MATHQAVWLEQATVPNAPHPAIALRHRLKSPVQLLLRSAYMGLFRLPLLPKFILKAGNYSALRLALTATSKPGIFGGAELDVYRQAWSQPGAPSSRLNRYCALPLSSGSTPRRIATPVRLIWGDRDTALERGLAADGLDWCDHGEVFHLANASHWLAHEEPTRVNALLLEFLNAGRGARPAH